MFKRLLNIVEALKEPKKELRDSYIQMQVLLADRERQYKAGDEDEKDVWKGVF